MAYIPKPDWNEIIKGAKQETTNTTEKEKQIKNKGMIDK